MNDTELPAFDSPEDEKKYLERVKWLERHPDNQSGADKTWVERLVETSREHFKQAVRIR